MKERMLLDKLTKDWGMSKFAATLQPRRFGAVSLGLLLFSSALADTFTYPLDSCVYPDGPISVTAKAFDAAGNVGESTITLNIAHKPVVTISYPANGSKVAGQIVIQAGSSSVCSCNQKLTIDGVMVSYGPCGQISYNWFATKAGKGSHVIALTAMNSNGDISTTQINVKV